jgi:hypothetical protein
MKGDTAKGKGSAGENRNIEISWQHVLFLDCTCSTDNTIFGFEIFNGGQCLICHAGERSREK